MRLCDKTIISFCYSKKKNKIKETMQKIFLLLVSNEHSLTFHITSTGEKNPRRFSTKFNKTKWKNV